MIIQYVILCIKRIYKFYQWLFISVLASCGLKIFDAIQGTFADPNFNPDDCGQTCGGSYEGTTMFYCEKDEICCPSGPSDQTCAMTCGPFDPNGIFNYYSSFGYKRMY